MKSNLFRLLCILATLAVATPILAQALNDGQGHPLKGVWLGDWGTGQGQRTSVIIEMNWDGKAITGTINPGPDAVRFTKADLNPSNWTVHFEAESKGVRYVIDGKIEDLGSLRRYIVGTWTQGSQKGDFKITRH
jgi:hypothetical protein